MACDDAVAPAGSAQVGLPAPGFNLPCVGPDSHDVRRVRLADYLGHWLVVVFYPHDFSFVCPTELAAFSARADDFFERGAAILAISVDPIELHQDWLETPASQGGAGPLQFPLASDTGGEVARAYGVYRADKRVASRGLFIIGPDGVLQYAVEHNLDVGRSTKETLRVLEALVTGELCPEGWMRADGTIDPALELGPGRVLGHYRIQHRIGQGGHALVFRAWDMWLQRDVALKIVRPGQRPDPSRLLAEARAVATLDHPNICSIYAVEEEDGLPIIVMEYLPGASLAARLSKGRLPDDQLRSIARQLAVGMAASHAEDIVHGDLKPRNIMVTPTGAVKILDFGLALRPRPTESEHSDRSPSVDETSDPEAGFGERARGASSAPNSRASGSTPTPSDTIRDTSASSRRPRLRGTPAFMAPEQAVGGPPSKASDVFAFGLVVYQMATGKRAVSNGSLRETLQTIRRSDLTLLARQTPEPYRGILLRALQRRPEDRPTMAEIVRLLPES